MFSLLNCNDEDNVNDYILTARIPSSMSVQIIQTPHGFSLIATRGFAPGEHVLDLTGITKTTKDRYSTKYLWMNTYIHSLSFKATRLTIKPLGCTQTTPVTQTL
jgi:hypothetical protein